MNKSNALTLVIMVVVTLLFQGCAYHDPTHVWCVSYSCHVTCESGPCSESCGHSKWHGSPEECKAEGGTAFKHLNYANNEFLRRISEKYTTTTAPVSKPKSSQSSKFKSKTSSKNNYVGEWKNGKPHGQGTYTWANGDEYTGKWEEGKRHGSGTLTSRFGGKLRGEWREDKIWSGIDYTADQKVIGTYVLGKWKKQKPHSPSVSKSKNKTFCNSSRLNSHERWRCATTKCLQYQMLLSLGGGNTSGWMAKCMALSGNSWPASGSRSSCTGPYCKYESAWDYLPGSGEWRCRDTGGARGGEFVTSSECSSQKQVDNWP